MSMSKKTAGKPHRVSRTARRGKASKRKIKGKVDLPVQVNNRKQAESHVQNEMEVDSMDRSIVETKEASDTTGRTRSNPVVYEAMDHLRTYGYEPAPIRASQIPLNIVAMKKSGSFFVLALRSRLPVPSAVKLRELFTGKVDHLRGMVERVRERIMILVYSPACGWRYYQVYPGGLRYDHNFPASIE